MNKTTLNNIFSDQPDAFSCVYPAALVFYLLSPQLGSVEMTERSLGCFQHIADSAGVSIFH